MYSGVTQFKLDRIIDCANCGFSLLNLFCPNEFRDIGDFIKVIEAAVHIFTSQTS